MDALQPTKHFAPTELDFFKTSQLPYFQALIAKKEAHISEVAKNVAPFEQVGILGAGLMGLGIAQKLLAAGINVLLCDISEEKLREAELILESTLKNDDRTLGNLQLTQKMEDLRQCDLIIETIVEELIAKRAVHRELGLLLGPETVVVTNTSTFPLNTFLLPHQERKSLLAGLHFCHPITERKLVEVVLPGKTEQATKLGERLFAHVGRLEMLPIVLLDAPSQVVNRLLAFYTNAGIRIVCQGIEPERIDTLAKKLGFLRGPLEQLDGIGLRTSLLAGANAFQAFRERLEPNRLLIDLVKRKQFGQHSGAGFYCYQNGKPTGTNPVLLEILGEANDPVDLSDLEIASELCASTLREALLIATEGNILEPSEIDLASVEGLGFSRERGGLHHLACGING